MKIPANTHTACSPASSCFWGGWIKAKMASIGLLCWVLSLILPDISHGDGNFDVANNDGKEAARKLFKAARVKDADEMAAIFRSKDYKKIEAVCKALGTELDRDDESLLVVWKAMFQLLIDGDSRDNSYYLTESLVARAYVVLESWEWGSQRLVWPAGGFLLVHIDEASAMIKLLAPRFDELNENQKNLFFSVVHWMFLHGQQAMQTTVQDAVEDFFWRGREKTSLVEFASGLAREATRNHYQPCPVVIYGLKDALAKLRKKVVMEDDKRQLQECITWLASLEKRFDSLPLNGERAGG